MTEQRGRARGELFDVYTLFPNPLNPKEMTLTNRLLLRTDLQNDDYDAITICPIKYYFTEQRLKTVRLFYETPDGVMVNCHDPENSYMILDGHHKVEEARQIEMTQIRGEVWYMKEAEALPYFYKRNKIRGELDPIKEAIQFQFELKVNKRTRAEIIEVYNLPGLSYYKTRLDLLKVSVGVIKLFYDQSADLPGELTISHLREISFLPKRLQKSVALFTLERSWTTEDVRLEVRRIKAGKGLRRFDATTEVPKEPPGERVVVDERPLWMKLVDWERKTIRNIYLAEKTGENIGLEELSTMVVIAESTLKQFLSRLVKEKHVTYMEEVLPRGGTRRLYRPNKPFSEFTAEDLEVQIEEPMTEPVKTDSEIFQDYPEEIVDTIQEEVTTLGESVDVEEPDVQPQQEIELDETPKDPGPLIFSGLLIDEFMHSIYITGIREGLDLREPIVRVNLNSKFDAAAKLYSTYRDPVLLSELILRLLQLQIIHQEEDVQ